MYINKNINICEKLEKYEEQCIYFCEPIKNNIINDGNFIRILYSKSFVLLNGIYLYFSLNIHSVEKYYNKLKCNFMITEHRDIKEKEKNTDVSQWSECNGISNFVLKISGVWENELYYGLTFKFVKSDCL